MTTDQAKTVLQSGIAERVANEVKDYAWRLGEAETSAKDSETTTADAIKETISQTLCDLIEDGNEQTTVGKAVRAIRERILGRIWSAFSVELIAMAELSALVATRGDTCTAKHLQAMPLAVLDALKKDR